jgi:hypothetical protein
LYIYLNKNKANMKKVMIIAALTFTLAACGSGESTTEPTVDSTAVDSTVVDSTAVDTTVTK